MLRVELQNDLKELANRMITDEYLNADNLKDRVNIDLYRLTPELRLEVVYQYIGMIMCIRNTVLFPFER